MSPLTFPAINGSPTGISTFDNNGNTLTETGRTYTFDAWNRIVTDRTTGSSFNTMTYSYDALGERVVENNVASGVATSLFYSESGQLVEEWQNGVVTYQYVWSQSYINDMVIRDAYDSSGTVIGRVYVLHDRNHNVTSLENTSGTTVERYLYDPFGFVAYMSPSYVVGSGSIYDWHYLFQGGRFDRSMNLYIFQARDYNPGSARWQERDPLGLAAGDDNVYHAFSGSPATLTDATGELSGPPRPSTDAPGLAEGDTNNGLKVEKGPDGVSASVEVNGLDPFGASESLKVTRAPDGSIHYDFEFKNEDSDTRPDAQNAEASEGNSESRFGPGQPPYDTSPVPKGTQVPSDPFDVLTSDSLIYQLYPELDPFGDKSFSDLVRPGGPLALPKGSLRVGPLEPKLIPIPPFQTPLLTPIRPRANTLQDRGC